MYAAGYGVRPIRSSRSRFGLGAAVRGLAVLLAAAGLGAALAIAAQGEAPPTDATIVVQPGDTVWSIAVARYPGDDVRARVQQIERVNGLDSPTIDVGETLRLPAS